MSSISDSIGITMEKIKEMIDVNTVVGNPITTPDGTTLIPVSKVSFGFASGGTDGEKMRFGAGSGAGVTITPIAFMVVKESNVRMIYIEPPVHTVTEKIIDMIPDISDKITGFINTKKTEKQEKESAKPSVY